MDIDDVIVTGIVTVGEQSGFRAGADEDYKKDPCNAINAVCLNLVNPDGDDDENADDDRWFHDNYNEYLTYAPTPTAASVWYVTAAMGYDYDASASASADTPASLLMVVSRLALMLRLRTQCLKRQRLK